MKNQQVSKLYSVKGEGGEELNKRNATVIPRGM